MTKLQTLIAALLLCFCRLPAFGENIPDNVLQFAHPYCVKGCEHHGGQTDSCELYCTCVDESEKKLFTFDEYMTTMKAIYANHTDPDLSPDLKTRYFNMLSTCRGGS